MEQNELEQTLVLIKPDALKVSLTGYILSQFSEFHTGLRYAGAKIVHVTRMLAEEHYAEHKGKVFYNALISYITGEVHYAERPQRRRVVAVVYCGPDAVKKVRSIAGPTNPHVARDTAPGTIRALGTVVPVKDDAGKVVGERLDNLVHASATVEEAEREIKLWFKPDDIMPYMRLYPTDISEEHYYYKEGRLLSDYEPGARCLAAPGDTVWKSDLEALRKLARGGATSCSLDAIAAKYLINQAILPQ
ncbi:MAG: nucleoside-diphosphate kinase [Thermoguttaceae bacterium]|jgi:nucleoside-diphosphate kinase|nr:nucleoside-diphosphate kinase [Thermoguttaceae bacterium]